MSGVVFDPHTGLHFGPARGVGLHLDCSSNFHTPRTFSRSVRVRGMNKAITVVRQTGGLGRRGSRDFDTSTSVCRHFNTFRAGFLVRKFCAGLASIFILNRPCGHKSNILIGLHDGNPNTGMIKMALRKGLTCLSLLRMRTKLALRHDQCSRPRG